MKIAVGGIHTECSTYSPLLQTTQDFQVVRGPSLLEKTGLSGNLFPDTVFHPLFHARSIPGGPVSPACYKSFKSEFLAELEAAMPLAGVLLTMHGAMQVPGIEDAEGDWISAVRGLVGPDLPIAVSYDLHGNLTQKIVDQIDIFCAYRTAPHIDVIATHLRAARNLVDQLRGGAKRSVSWVPVPVLHPGERTSTEDEPAASLYSRLMDIDERDGVTDANLMIGYVWADTGRATAAAVVTGTARHAINQAAEEIAAAYWSARETFNFGVTARSLEGCLADIAEIRTAPVILADSGDNPTGGGVGDRADVLDAWLESGRSGAVFAGIADPGSVDASWKVAEGTEVDLHIGGGYGSKCPKVSAKAIVGHKLGSPDAANREVLVHLAGNRVILTEHRRPFHALEDFRRFDIDPHTVSVLVVKSGYLSPELAPLANPSLMALTQGAVNQQIIELENKTGPTPLFRFSVTSNGDLLHGRLPEQHHYTMMGIFRSPTGRFPDIFEIT